MSRTPDTISTLRDVVARCRTIAVVGLSPQWHRPSLFAAFMFAAFILPSAIVGAMAGPEEPRFGQVPCI